MNDGGGGGEGGTPPRYRRMPSPVGAGLPHEADYDTTTPGVVVDKLTGLHWQRDLTAGNEGQYALGPASAHCELLEFAGSSDWRLPNRAELLTLIDFTSTSGSLLDPQTFGDIADADKHFWSSDEFDFTLSTNVRSYWFVDFATAGSGRMDGNKLKRARCVRGAAFEPVYLAGENAEQGTVLDKTTGLQWQQGVGPAGHFDTTYCADLTLAGHDDWRVPNVKELLLLVDLKAKNPALDSLLFPTEEPYLLLSSTRHAKISFVWLVVDFTDGNLVQLTLSESAPVRCVRSVL
jgi:hypothetical protein